MCGQWGLGVKAPAGRTLKSTAPFPLHLLEHLQTRPNTETPAHLNCQAENVRECQVQGGGLGVVWDTRYLKGTLLPPQLPTVSCAAGAPQAAAPPLPSPDPVLPAPCPCLLLFRASYSAGAAYETFPAIVCPKDYQLATKDADFVRGRKLVDVYFTQVCARGVWAEFS